MYYSKPLVGNIKISRAASFPSDARTLLGPYRNWYGGNTESYLYALLERWKHLGVYLIIAVF